jgi:hypothetical protein
VPRWHYRHLLQGRGADSVSDRAEKAPGHARTAFLPAPDREIDGERLCYYRTFRLRRRVLTACLWAKRPSCQSDLGAAMLRCPGPRE